MFLTQRSKGAFGAVGGVFLSPWTGAGSWLRHGRLFHPTGMVFAAEVSEAGVDTAGQAIAERLAGPALVRLSSAWWKRGEWLDVLGCAVRFTRPPFQEAARSGDQDLLFATTIRPWTLPFSALTTKNHDFLANDYYAVSPFEVDGLGSVEWRLRALWRTDEPHAVMSARSIADASPLLYERHGARRERLLNAVASGHAEFLLEYAPYRSPSRIHDESSFRPVVRVTLRQELPLDQQALRFDAFRDGRGLKPVGFIHGLRRATYASSRRQPSEGQHRRGQALLGAAGAAIATLGVGLSLRRRWR